MPWRLRPVGGSRLIDNDPAGHDPDDGYDDGDDAYDGYDDDGYGDERDATRGEPLAGPRWRQLSLRGGVALAVAIVLAAVIGMQASDAQRARRVRWCRDAASQISDDGFGWENGRLCRVSSVGSAAAPTTTPATTAPVVTLPAGPQTTAAPTTEAPATTAAPTTAAPAAASPGGGYQANLNLIRSQPWRNKNEDASADRAVPSDKLVLDKHYGPRSEYLNNPGGNPEEDFPVEEGGQFRVGCEFSHFGYDDPLVFPNQPGASHLHIFFGNTDANAYSTPDSILNSGGSTCNGGELNRTSYWAPAMFDGQGNVRVPERLIVYYKGEGLANGKAEVFPFGAAMIAKTDLNTIDTSRGGVLGEGKFSFMCTDNYRGGRQPAANTMVSCDGNASGGSDPHTVLEMNVKFPQCWNGKDPHDYRNYAPPSAGGWYGSNCQGEFSHTFTNMEYLIAYPVAPGETTAGWYLASDVDPASRTMKGAPGASNHADWFDGWNTKVNKLWIDNCVNFRNGSASGCGFGYLSNGGPDNQNPLPGPALKYRQQYTGSMKVPAADIHKTLCPGGGNLASPMAAAYCKPAAMAMKTSAVSGTGGGGSVPVFCQLQAGLAPTTRRDGAQGPALT